jgi:hypothetical protein
MLLMVVLPRTMPRWEASVWDSDSLRGEVVPEPEESPPYLVTGTVGQRESDDGQGAFRAGSGLNTINLVHVAGPHLGDLQLGGDEEVADAGQQEVEGDENGLK